MKSANWILFLIVAAVMGIIVFFVVIMREPVPETAGTAPSVITGGTGAGTEPITAPPPGQEPREVEASSTAARGARGSGIEGVTSGGTTTAPPR